MRPNRGISSFICSFFFSQVAQSDRTPTTFAAWFPGFQKILDGQVKYI